MNLKTKIKKSLMLRVFSWKKKKRPYDEAWAEKHTLPLGRAHIENDSHFFNANSASEEITLSGRLGRRSGGIDEVFILYKNGGKFYVQESDTYQREATPLKATLVKVGERWLYEFNGNVIDTDDGSRHKLSFKAEFFASKPIYDYFYHCKRFDGMARAIAEQPWSRAYFAKLGEMNQRHYEQTGVMRISLSLDYQDVEFEIPSTRDHSFGVRDWDYMDDHIWFACQNDAGNAVCFSVVNYPVMKKIYSGYTDFGKDGKSHSLTAYHIEGYSHNKGVGPDELEFDCTMDDGEQYHITMKRDSNTQVYFDGGDYMFQEGLATFMINGVKFRGTIEYGFNKDKDRWEYYQ